jgi:hypothetical protein
VSPRRIPQPAGAVLEALRLDRRDPPVPESWPEALAFADRTHVTLPWRARLADVRVPADVRERLDRNRTGNSERLRRIRELSGSIGERFDHAGIDYVTLKGLSHSPDFIADPRDRVQYDLDFYCPAESVSRARDVLLAMGYEPLAILEDLPTDHLPTLIRKTGWQWRGDYFDPDHPPSIDLHFRFWDEATEQIAAPGADQFWERRTGHQLDLVDRLGYAALHALRHLLRGTLLPAQVYEIACLLENRRDDAAFWSRWREWHPPELRALESIIFGLAREYFGCSVPEAPPAAAGAWIERYGWSPIEGLFRPNKDELVLHLALGPASRWRVLRRRLAPLRLPGMGQAANVPDEQITAGLRLRMWARYAVFLSARVVHHTRALLPALWALRRGGRL